MRDDIVEDGSNLKNYEFHSQIFLFLGMVVFEAYEELLSSS